MAKTASHSLTTSPADELVRPSAEALIRLRHYAGAIDMSSGLVHGKQTGNRVSPFKGRGMDYEESRRYQIGDDRRNLDWRVMARTGKPYTKLFREERERPVYLCLDVSPSMQFATHGSFKSVVAAQCLALLGWTAFAHGDRVGGIVFGGPLRLERRPTRGKRAILNWIHDVCRSENWTRDSLHDGRELKSKLQRINAVSRPGSLLAIASDWRDFDEATERQLMKLAQHNTVLLLFIYDALEHHLPPPGVYPVTQGDGVMALDSRGGQRRRRYTENFEQRQAHLLRVAVKMQAALITVATHDNPVRVLINELR